MQEQIILEKTKKICKAILGEDAFNGIVQIADELYPNNTVYRDRLICDLCDWIIKNPKAESVTIRVSEEVLKVLKVL